MKTFEEQKEELANEIYYAGDVWRSALGLAEIILSMQHEVARQGAEIEGLKAERK